MQPSNNSLDAGVQFCGRGWPPLLLGIGVTLADDPSRPSGEWEALRNPKLGEIIRSNKSVATGSEFQLLNGIQGYIEEVWTMMKVFS